MHSLQWHQCTAMTGGLRSWHACRLVRWDMRAREGAVQDSPVLTYQEGKDYASKTNFNCMATSGGACHAQLCPKVRSCP